MKKINLDNDIIKSDLDAFNSRYSSIQIAIAVFGTILIAFVISLKSYINLASLVIAALVVVILVLLYLILEFKRNDLVEKWEVKDTKIILKNKSDELLTLLDEKSNLIITYRIKYPETSMNELAEIISLETQTPITKSGLNHRFRKIKEIAERLRQKKEKE